MWFSTKSPPNASCALVEQRWLKIDKSCGMTARKRAAMGFALRSIQHLRYSCAVNNKWASNIQLTDILQVGN